MSALAVWLFASTIASAPPGVPDVHLVEERGTVGWEICPTAVPDGGVAAIHLLIADDGYPVREVLEPVLERRRCAVTWRTAYDADASLRTRRLLDELLASHELTLAADASEACARRAADACGGSARVETTGFKSDAWPNCWVRCKSREDGIALPIGYLRPR
jgi:hypothetical protein